MMFHVRMTVHLPHDLPAAEREQLIAAERQRAQELQHSGQWRHLWRIAGHYANVSVFDVDSPATLHSLLSSLPLFGFMDIEVQALCRHPSSIHDDDR